MKKKILDAIDKRIYNAKNKEAFCSRNRMPLRSEMFLIQIKELKSLRNEVKKF